MKSSILIAATIALGLSACQEKVDPVDTFNVTVELRNGGAKYVTGDVTLNPKDSIYFDFTITSPADMSFVEIQKNGTRLDTFRLNSAANKKTFSLIKGYQVDSASGVYNYRIMARNERAVYMGDGGKQIKVTVNPDFYFWSDRVLQVPDTGGQFNKYYFSTIDGKTHTFLGGGAVSASIDFGYFWDTTGRGTAVATDDLKHTIYSINAIQPQINFNDVNNWTKNVTLLKKMPTSVNFVSGLTSAGAIQTLIGGNMTSGTSSKISTVANTSGNNVIGFRTAAGKFGAILIRRTTGDDPSKTTEIEVDVKVQK